MIYYYKGFSGSCSYLRTDMNNLSIGSKYYIDKPVNRVCFYVETIDRNCCLKVLTDESEILAYFETPIDRRKRIIEEIS